jgi:hypothetical protein
MGLDIRAVSKIEIEQPAEVKAMRRRLFIGGGEEEVFTLDSDLRKIDVYSMHTQDMKNGTYYETSESKSESISFSYGGYNSFRNEISLALIDAPATEVWINEQYYKESPAYKLINFSDCEGLFGPTVSKEIYEQLVANRDKYAEYIEKREDTIYPLPTYDKLTEIFRLGADEGIIMFH